jgi:hypothetical protein
MPLPVGWEPYGIGPAVAALPPPPQPLQAQVAKKSTSEKCFFLNLYSKPQSHGLRQAHIPTRGNNEEIGGTLLSPWCTPARDTGAAEGDNLRAAGSVVRN